MADEPVRRAAGAQGAYAFESCEVRRTWTRWYRAETWGGTRRVVGDDGGFVVAWAVTGLGSGELTFRLKGGRKPGPDDLEVFGARLRCDSEGKPREFVRQALLALADRAFLRDDDGTDPRPPAARPSAP